MFWDVCVPCYALISLDKNQDKGKLADEERGEGVASEGGEEDVFAVLFHRRGGGEQRTDGQTMLSVKVSVSSDNDGTQISLGQPPVTCVTPLTSCNAILRSGHRAGRRSSKRTATIIVTYVLNHLDKSLKNISIYLNFVQIKYFCILKTYLVILWYLAPYAGPTLNYRMTYCLKHPRDMKIEVFQ